MNTKIEEQAEALVLLLGKLASFTAMSMNGQFEEYGYTVEHALFLAKDVFLSVGKEIEGWFDDGKNINKDKISQVTEIERNLSCL